MDSIMGFLTSAYEFVHAGFSDVKSQVMALVIALLAAILMTSWGRLIFTAIGAAIVHVLIGAVLPMAQGGALAFPDIMGLPFWKGFAGLSVGYLIIIGVFFFLKHNVFKMGRHGGH